MSQCVDAEGEVVGASSYCKAPTSYRQSTQVMCVVRG